MELLAAAGWNWNESPLVFHQFFARRKRSARLNNRVYFHCSLLMSKYWNNLEMVLHMGQMQKKGGNISYYAIHVSQQRCIEGASSNVTLYMIENMTFTGKNKNEYARNAASIINLANLSDASHAGDMKGVHVQQQNLRVQMCQRWGVGFNRSFRTSLSPLFSNSRKHYINEDSVKFRPTKWWLKDVSFLFRWVTFAQGQLLKFGGATTTQRLLLHLGERESLCPLRSKFTNLWKRTQNQRNSRLEDDQNFPDPRFEGLDGFGDGSHPPYCMSKIFGMNFSTLLGACGVLIKHVS